MARKYVFGMHSMCIRLNIFSKYMYALLNFGSTLIRSKSESRKISNSLRHTFPETKLCLVVELSFFSKLKSFGVQNFEAVEMKWD